MMDWQISAFALIIRGVLWAILTTPFPPTITQNIADNRCYLESGASSESFFVSEDLSIGSTIGQVRIHGDPRPGGNIALHLREPDSPVAITQGTRNLTLRRRLDKEGINGPSSVFINLICERLRTVDPGFVIPINIRVTDANDNAPKFINAPYILNISEVTVVGTRVLQGVHAIDDDQQGPFSSVRYSVLPGQHSDYFEFENELEGTLVLKKPLDFESLRSFDVKIRAQDHGEPPKATDTILTVHVVDADDQNPKFLDERYYTILEEPPLRTNTLNVKPRDIKAFDQDLGINSPVFYTFNGVGADYSLFKINRNSGKVSLAKDLIQNDLQHPATLVIRATQQDNPDRYALATLTVSRFSGNAIRFLRRMFHVKASESLPSGATLTILATSRPGESLKYFVSDKSILKTFTISAKGELSLKAQLDYEKQSEYVFKVFATDGITNDSCAVNVTVEDVNEWEPQFRYSHYEFFLTEQSSDLIGRIEVGDGDTKDKLTISLAGANASLFDIKSNGELRLKELNDKGEHTGVANLAVVASDNGNPPRSASVPVIVHFQNGPGSGGLLSAGRNNTGPLVLGALVTILLLLGIVIAILVVYICKARKSAKREVLPTSEPEKSPTPSAMDKVSTNPMFGDLRTTSSVSVMGGLASSTNRAKPSPKVNPAPLPPSWPSSAIANRVKKLSWGDDRTDSDSIDNIHNLDIPHKLTDNSNLTVYF